MSQHKVRDAESATLSRRTVIGALGAGIAVAGSGASLAQPVAPPSTITNPPRDFGRQRRADDLFHRSRRPHGRSGVRRHRAAEQRHPAPVDRRALVGGPGLERRRAATSSGATSPTTASCAGSRTTAASRVFRMPSNNSNGNTFDFQGRQLSCEHLTRRVVRYEHDGSITVLADTLQRQAAQLAERRRAASRRQLLVHRSALRRPALRGRARRRRRAEQSRQGGSSPGSASRRASASTKRELPTNCYRVDPSGRIDLVVTEDQVPDPNGLCFSPDYKKLYVVSTGKGPGDTGPGRQGRHVRLRRRRRQQALEPASCSPTSWSTA